MRFWGMYRSLLYGTGKGYRVQAAHPCPKTHRVPSGLTEVDISDVVVGFSISL